MSYFFILMIMIVILSGVYTFISIVRNKSGRKVYIPAIIFVIATLALLLIC